MLSNARVAVASIVLITGAIISYCYVGRVVSTPIKKPLNTFPSQIGNWNLVDKSNFTAEIETLLGVDDYIQYDYARADGTMLNLYVSYFGQVSSGSKGYHSPKHCLPGAGWNVINSDHIELSFGNPRPHGIEVNKMTVQKNSSKSLVLYWYQCRGRIISSEYLEKAYLVLDSILKQRSDGTFIRIVIPITNGNEERALKDLQAFATQVIPLLEDYLPGA